MAKWGMSKATSRNPDLDGIRGIAILCVMYAHAGWAAGLPLAMNAWVGVDIFFVLSGFLITSILLGRVDADDYYRHFYKRRTLRIFPAFYLFLVAMFGINMALGRHVAWRDLAISATFTSSIFTRQLFADLPSNRTLGEALLTLWSVSVEELFYIFWAPAVRLLRSPRRLAVLPIMVIVAEPFIRFYLHSGSWFPEYYLIAGRLDGIALGSLMAIWIKYRDHSKRLRSLSVRIILVLTIIDVVFFAHYGFQRERLGFAVGGYSLIALTAGAILLWLIARSGERTLVQRLIRNRVFVYFGTRSYAQYLLNYALILPLQIYFIAAFPLHRRLAYALGGSSGVILAIIGAEISWRVMEKHLIGKREEKRAVQQEIAAAS